ncbi:SDR family oxidoreductase [Teredinibacter purpureus]|uniref:SDR family oxidoreductase n=1 Tax=Teredinibacter purpureus TaxID=2731756 RepID=UPI0005F84870|nr:SDR family oxidoreductase [Teredinibacter purpureus]
MYNGESAQEVHVDGSLEIQDNSTATRYYFITGATGLMASEFLAQVLTCDPTAQCYVLIRAECDNRLETRLNKLLTYLFPDSQEREHYRCRVQAVRGDVTVEGLGLSENDYRLISSRCTHILHAAALTDWGASHEDAWRSNVDGVNNILAFAEHCMGQLEKLVHISSAYVSGFQKGLIQPDVLSCDTPACDNYQLSKREGERLMRASWNRLPITIVRPTAVVGNAQNGRTLSYTTFYFPLQLLYNGLTLILPVAKNGHLEAVPSDWAARVMFACMHKPNTGKQCYHLSVGEGVRTNGEIRTIVYNGFNRINEYPKPTRYVPYWFYAIFLSPLLRLLLPKGKSLDEKIKLYRHYMTVKRTFDNKKTLALLNSNDRQPPCFSEYLPTLLEYAIDNRWRSRREKRSGQREVQFNKVKS